MNSNVKNQPTRIITAIIATTMLVLPGGCKTEKVNCQWADQPVQIDGKITDWDEIPGRFYSDKKASVALVNDSTNLYLNFRTTNAVWARTIKRSGLTLFVNVNGKRDKNFFVKFIGGPSYKDLMRSQRELGPQPSPARMRGDLPEEIIDRKARFTCYDKDRIIEKPIPLNGSEGPSVAFDTSLGFYSYEFLLPLRSSTVRNYGINAQPGDEIMIGVEWGEMTGRPPGGMGGGRGSGGMGGGRGSGGMGGGRGSGGRGMGGGRPEMPQKQEIWFKTELALPDGSSPSEQ